MRFRYSTTAPSQDEFDSLPRIPLTLQYEGQSVEVVGLVDSGSTVNVFRIKLEYNFGQLGTRGKQISGWQAVLAIIQQCLCLLRQRLRVLGRSRWRLLGSIAKMRRSFSIKRISLWHSTFTFIVPDSNSRSSQSHQTEALCRATKKRAGP